MMEGIQKITLKNCSTGQVLTKAKKPYQSFKVNLSTLPSNQNKYITCLNHDRVMNNTKLI